jgi:Ni,Fe-hydrogenase III large subunit
MWLRLLFRMLQICGLDTFVELYAEQREYVEAQLQRFEQEAEGEVLGACMADLDRLEEHLEQFHAKHKEAEHDIHELELRTTTTRGKVTARTCVWGVTMGTSLHWSGALPPTEHSSSASAERRL